MGEQRHPRVESEANQMVRKRNSTRTQSDIHPYIHTSIHSYIHTYIHTYSLAAPVFFWTTNACVPVRWFAKRFLHPDIVDAYEYIFLWDQDVDVTNFDPSE